MLTHMHCDEIRQLFFSLPVAACLVDRNLRYVAANEKYASIIGAQISEMKGRHMNDFWIPEVVENARRDFYLLDRGKPVPDHEISFKGGNYLVSVGPVYQTNPERADAISVTISNISLLKQLEAALAASNEKLSSAYDQISAMAQTDPLTGLLNRYGLQKVMDQETRRCQRNGHPLSLVMIDVDWFKPYNDLYGHVAGDATLQAVSKAIRSTIQRPGDCAARYGGEEFVLVLPNTPAAGAEHIGTAVKHAIHDLAIVHRGSQFNCVTVSVGIASIESVPRELEPGKIYEALLREADSALYAVKGSGRNGLKIFRGRDLYN